MIDFAKSSKSHDKQGAAMAYDTPLSLSLQKEIEKRNLPLDSAIHTALQAFKVRSLLGRCNIMKAKGYTTASLLYWLLLLPFIMKRTTFLWTGNTGLNARKDTFFRSSTMNISTRRAFTSRLVLRSNRPL